MITFKTPTTFPAFIDRFLVTAKAYEIKTILVFNKIDLYTCIVGSAIKSCPIKPGQVPRSPKGRSPNRFIGKY